MKKVKKKKNKINNNFRKNTLNSYYFNGSIFIKMENNLIENIVKKDQDNITAEIDKLKSSLKEKLDQQEYLDKKLQV